MRETKPQMPAPQVLDSVVDGFPALTLRAGQLQATYVPGVGMVCCSFRHAEVELLGQRHGLSAYAQRSSTMGIPLLHPWANRLERLGYEAGTARIKLPHDSPHIHLDGNDRPIHGLLAACPDWRIVHRTADTESANLEATLDVAQLPEVLELFPFPHELRIAVTLTPDSLRVETTLTPSSDVAVPVAFGYHPYLTLPDTPRAEWLVSLPVRERAILDAGSIPTGETVETEPVEGALEDRVYDDLFTRLEADPLFTVTGRDREITVAFGSGYEVAVVYAPADDDVICFEPMTAPTNPFDGAGALRWAEPGRPFSATFAISVK